MSKKCLCVGLVMGLISHPWNEGVSDVTVTAFTVSNTWFSISITGTLLGPEPPFNRNFLFIVSANTNDNFVLTSSLVGVSPTSSSDMLIGDDGVRSVVFDNNQGFDVIGLYTDGFVWPHVGEAVTGTVSAVIPEGVFDAESLSEPMLYWGRAGTGTPPFSGTFQAVVPEPSLPALILCAFGIGPLIGKRARRLRLSGKCRTTRWRGALPPKAP